jgi:hypothetical protein
LIVEDCEKSEKEMRQPPGKPRGSVVRFLTILSTALESQVGHTGRPKELF